MSDNRINKAAQALSKELSRAVCPFKTGDVIRFNVQYGSGYQLSKVYHYAVLLAGDGNWWSTGRGLSLVSSTETKLSWPELVRVLAGDSERKVSDIKVSRAWTAVL
jgi:hypothetical protein